MKIRLSLILILLFLVGCTSVEKNEPEEPSVAAQSSGRMDRQEIQIDTDGLRSSLGLDRDSRALGFREAMFDTCKVGFGFPRNQDCRRQYLVVIHFRLQCRDTQGTISTALAASDLQPIAYRPIEWGLKNLNGIARTDSEGFGQITVLSAIPQKTQRLRFATGNQFLYIRAGEVNRIVTPSPWCSEGVAEGY